MGRPVESCATEISHGHVEKGCQTFCRYYCDQGYEVALIHPFVDCALDRDNTWLPSKYNSLTEDDLCRPFPAKLTEKSTKPGQKKRRTFKNKAKRSYVNGQYECPLSWIKRDHMCYIVRYDALSWPSAKLECQQVGGDLVVMNDRNTRDYIAGLVNKEIWTGLNDRASDEKYVWLDTTDEPSTTFWKEEEVTDSHITDGRYLRNCVALINRQWVSYSCGSKLGYVCQRRAEYNIAPGKNASQSSIHESNPAQRAIEGCATRHFDKACCAHTLREWSPWWEMDMGKTYEIGRIVIHRRYDEGCEYCKRRLHNFRLFLSNASQTTDERYMVFQDTRPKPPPEITIDLVKSPVTARYVRTDIPNRSEYLTLCEVQVFQANCYFDSTKWNGSISYTTTGRKCQEWVRDTPHEHNYHTNSKFPSGSQIGANSYCRDPEGDGTPWCYTLDPNVRWEYCGIPQCATNADQDINGAQETEDEGCGVGWYRNPKSSQCYKIGKEKLCWSDAISSCEMFGGNLLVNVDEPKYQFIKERFAQEMASLNSEVVWLDIYDTEQDVRWGSTRANVDISSLPLNQLPGPSNNSNCVAMRTNDVLLSSLIVRSCSERLPYVCERLGQSPLCPATITNGEIVTNCLRTVGAKCKYSCDRYFCAQYIGKNYLTCQSDLTWDWGDQACNYCQPTTPAPVCSSTIPRGTIPVSCGRHIGSYCSYMCDIGCRKTRSTLYCTKWNHWDYPYVACNCGQPTTPAPVCSSTIPRGTIPVSCGRHIGSYCSYMCDIGCRKTRSTLYCTKWNHWDYPYVACNCETAENRDTSPSEDMYETSPGHTIWFIIIGVVVLIVVVCVVSCYVYRKQQEGIHRRQNQPTSETPVVYHPVTSSTQVVTNGRRDNPPNYITISGSSNEGIPEPLLPYTQTTPSAPYEPSEETGGGVSLSEPGVNLDGYPPPPSYNEVVNDPEKFQTQSEHRETQAE